MQSPHPVNWESTENILPSTNLLSEKKHLKAILQSRRANIYYLEYCRILQNGGGVEYITQEKISRHTGMNCRTGSLEIAIAA